MHFRLVYHTYRLCRCLGYNSILKSCDSQSHPAIKMASYKTCLQSEDEIVHMLEESGSEGDSVFQKVKTVFKVKAKVKVKTIQKKVQQKILKQVTVMKQCHQHRKEQRKRVGSGL